VDSESSGNQGVDIRIAENQAVDIGTSGSLGIYDGSALLTTGLLFLCVLFRLWRTTNGIRPVRMAGADWICRIVGTSIIEWHCAEAANMLVP
jgi:hypothetical protein